MSSKGYLSKLAGAKANIACYSSEFILDLINQAFEKIDPILVLPTGKKVALNKTIRTFYRCGAECNECGRIADYFIERHVASARNKSRWKHEDFSRLLLFDKSGVQFGADHILPRFLGGTGNNINLRTLCHQCDNAKGSSYSGPIIERFRKADYKDKLKQKYNGTEMFDKFYHDYNVEYEVNFGYDGPLQPGDSLKIQIFAEEQFKKDPHWGYLKKEEFLDWIKSVKEEYGLETDFDSLKPYNFAS